LRRLALETDGVSSNLDVQVDDGDLTAAAIITAGGGDIRLSVPAACSYSLQATSAPAEMVRSSSSPPER
jgi:hypothetical protein